MLVQEITEDIVDGVEAIYPGRVSEKTETSRYSHI